MLQDVIDPFIFGLILFFFVPLGILMPFWIKALLDLGKEYPEKIEKEESFDYSKLGANDRRMEPTK